MTQPLPPKKEVALALLERSNVDVYLDPRAKGVVVPPQFRKEPRLILKIGLNMPVPIPDLRLDEESMSCTLSFNRSPFYCVVPWTSVFAMVGEDGRGMVWPDDVPQELAVKVSEPGDRSAGGAEREASRADQAGAGAAGTTASRRNGRAAKLVEDLPAGSSKGGAGGKRKKKKDEGGRPMLVSVPPPPPDPVETDEGAAAAAAQTPASSRGREPVRDGVSAIPDSGTPRMPRMPELRQKGAAPSAPSSPATPSARRPPAEEARRPKRELPPYLRVVK